MLTLLCAAALVTLPDPLPSARLLARQDAAFEVDPGFDPGAHTSSATALFLSAGATLAVVPAFGAAASIRSTEPAVALAVAGCLLWVLGPSAGDFANGNTPRALLRSSLRLLLMALGTTVLATGVHGEGRIREPNGFAGLVCVVGLVGLSVFDVVDAWNAPERANARARANRAAPAAGW